MTQTTEIVMTALEYQPQDLQDNRAGQLGSWQRARVERLRQQSLIGGGAVIAFLLVIGLFPTLSAGSVSLPGLIFLGAIAVIGLVIGFLIWRNSMRVQRDLATGKVEQASGAVTLTSRTTTSMHERVGRGGYRTRSKTSYTLQVGDELFSIPKAVYESFWDGKPYTVYYLPQSRIVVGAECMVE